MKFALTSLSILASSAAFAVPTVTVTCIKNPDTNEQKEFKIEKLEMNQSFHIEGVLDFSFIGWSVAGPKYGAFQLAVDDCNDVIFRDVKLKKDSVARLPRKLKNCQITCKVDKYRN